MYDVIVIGGGPAGMLAAGTAAGRGKSTLLLEKNEKLGKKLYITGKGRCNLTNACDCEEFLTHVPRNPRFLYSALYAFPPEALCEMIEALGVPLKVERGRRVFPVSDKASDIIRALTQYLSKEGAQVRLNAPIAKIERVNQGFLVCAGEEQYNAGSVILATGGLSYPATGSTGEGMRFAVSLGHTLVPCRPALTSLRLEGKALSALAGVCLVSSAQDHELKKCAALRAR